MMADRPEDFPQWASEDEVDATSGQLNVVEPPPERKQSGWTRREIPPRQWVNWLARRTWQWITWQTEQIDTLDGRVTANEGDLSSATNLPTPETLARRDAAGRMRAADPVAVQDVVTKGFLDPGGFGQSLTTNGYTALPGGLIIQWFEHSPGPLGNNESFTVNFPASFPNAAFQVIIGGTAGNIGGVAGTEGMDVISFGAQSATCVSSWNSFPAGNGSPTVRFIAIGY